MNGNASHLPRMTHTRQRAGRAVAVYVEDGQGRRLVVAREENGALVNPVTVAFTKKEARDAIAALMQLAEELP